MSEETPSDLGRDLTLVRALDGAQGRMGRMGRRIRYGKGA
jgi:hypothetical protein